MLGFEFGYSLDSPDALVLWEAQFGDFANGAQVIIDQFICCSSSKWQRDSGLVMLLPHGYEGQGPGAFQRPPGTLPATGGEDNIQVAYPTTPAQYFHLLRRQMHRNFRKPLIVMTPKSLLRHKLAVSPVEELTDGGFQEVSTIAGRSGARAARGAVQRQGLLRPARAAGARTKRRSPWFASSSSTRSPPRRSSWRCGAIPKAKEYVWVQEESQNMGGWFFVEPRLRAMGFRVKYVGRDASASPATGSRRSTARAEGTGRGGGHADRRRTWCARTCRRRSKRLAEVGRRRAGAVEKRRSSKWRREGRPVRDRHVLRAHLVAEADGVRAAGLP